MTAERSILSDYVKWIDCQYWHITNEHLNVEPHRHGQYEFILALTDNIAHRINGTMQILSEGTLLFIRPDDEHEFISIPGKNQEFICFSYTKEAFNRFSDYMAGTDFPLTKLLNSPLPPMCRLSKYEKEHIYIRIQDLNYVRSEDKDRINTNFRLLLCDIFTHFADSSPDNYSNIFVPDWLDRTCAKMKMRENFSLGLSKMIELSEKTPEHLSRSIKKYFGITPSEYINNIRLDFAANQLLTTSNSVLDICLDSGFDNTVYFHKKFKEKFGETPSHFRKKSI